MPFMSQFIEPKKRRAWKVLEDLCARKTSHLRELLCDSARNESLRANAVGIELDLTHQRVDAEIMSALQALAVESALSAHIQAMFCGERINATENREVLHVALRGTRNPPPAWGEDISQQVSGELKRVLAFAHQVRNGECLGFSGQAITDVVNLGIGGSDLGPRMCTQALADIAGGSVCNVKVHYASNLDADCLAATLAPLRAQSTLFIVQSKTFTTQETMMQARSAKRWLADAGCSQKDMARHLVAVTAQPQLAYGQGFSQEQTFCFWQWVGGRFSVWSAIGLPLAIAIGPEKFEEMLAGANAMDTHFAQTPFDRNLPVLLAILGIWNTNFLNCSTQLIAAYAWRLGLFAPFLQQLEMESNGKSTHVDGSQVQIHTSPVVWGGLGIDGQHAYFQLVHQGTHVIPVDFIGVRIANESLPFAKDHHLAVLQNMQAQADALALGRTREDTETLLRAQGLAEKEVQRLAAHRSYRGNVPSSSLWLERLEPYTLGALIALYEHKVFCQSVLWGTHAFDQWGVELGKTMVQQMVDQSSRLGCST